MAIKKFKIEASEQAKQLAKKPVKASDGEWDKAVVGFIDTIPDLPEQGKVISKTYKGWPIVIVGLGNGKCLYHSYLQKANAASDIQFIRGLIKRGDAPEKAVENLGFKTYTRGDVEGACGGKKKPVKSAAGKKRWGLYSDFGQKILNETFDSKREAQKAFREYGYTKDSEAWIEEVDETAVGKFDKKPANSACGGKKPVKSAAKKPIKSAATNTDLERAKQNIVDGYNDEYDRDFTVDEYFKNIDLSQVPILYTTIGGVNEDEHDYQLYADLTDPKIIVEIDGETIYEDKFPNIGALADDLEDFDWQNWYSYYLDFVPDEILDGDSVESACGGKKSVKSAARKPARRSVKAADSTIKRYSDVVPKEDRKYWYFTTHGLGPGMIPRGINVLKVQEGQNKNGTWGDFILLDAILNTDELKQYDLIELAPKDVNASTKRKSMKKTVKASKRSRSVKAASADGYDFAFYRDGYRVLTKTESNRGKWLAQKDDEEPFEITYEQARGFEPIDPKNRALQLKVGKALKFPIKSAAEDSSSELNKVYQVLGEMQGTWKNPETGWTGKCELYQRDLEDGSYVFSLVFGNNTSEPDDILYVPSKHKFTIYPNSGMPRFANSLEEFKRNLKAEYSYLTKIKDTTATVKASAAAKRRAKQRVAAAEGYFADDLNAQNSLKILETLRDRIFDKFNGTTIGDVTIDVGEVRPTVTKNAYKFEVFFASSDYNKDIKLEIISDADSSRNGFLCRTSTKPFEFEEQFELKMSGSASTLSAKIEQIAKELSSDTVQTSVKCSRSEPDDRFQVQGYIEANFRGLMEDEYFRDFEDAKSFAHDLLMQGYNVAMSDDVSGAYVEITADEYQDKFDGEFVVNEDIADFQDEVWRSMGIGASITASKYYQITDHNNDEVGRSDIEDEARELAKKLLRENNEDHYDLWWVDTDPDSTDEDVFIDTIYADKPFSVDGYYEANFRGLSDSDTFYELRDALEYAQELLGKGLSVRLECENAGGRLEITSDEYDEFVQTADGAMFEDMPEIAEWISDVQVERMDSRQEPWLDNWQYNTDIGMSTNAGRKFVKADFNDIEDIEDFYDGENFDNTKALGAFNSDTAPYDVNTTVAEYITDNYGIYAENVSYVEYNGPGDWVVDMSQSGQAVADDFVYFLSEKDYDLSLKLYGESETDASGYDMTKYYGDSAIHGNDFQFQFYPAQNQWSAPQVDVDINELIQIGLTQEEANQVVDLVAEYEQNYISICQDINYYIESFLKELSEEEVKASTGVKAALGNKNKTDYASNPIYELDKYVKDLAEGVAAAAGITLTYQVSDEAITFIDGDGTAVFIQPISEITPEPDDLENDIQELVSAIQYEDSDNPEYWPTDTTEDDPDYATRAVQMSVDDELEPVMGESSLSAKIFEFLDEEGGYTDYDQKIEDVAEEFNLPREEAESYVWDWSNGLNKSGDEGEDVGYGIDSYGGTIDESTVWELFRIADTEILPNTELAKLDPDVSIDEDSWDFYFGGISNTGMMGVVKFYIHFKLTSDNINLNEYVLPDAKLYPDFNYYKASLDFDIYIENGKITDVVLESADIYKSDNSYDDHFSGKFGEAFNTEALENYIEKLAAPAAEEIYNAVSNL